MPKKFPQEFKRDVVTVARRGDLSVAEVAVDFGIAEETVRRWMRQADVDDGIKDGLTSRAGRGCPDAPHDPSIGDGERDPPTRGGLLRQGCPPKMKFPLVRELAAEGFPVRLTCGFLSLLPGLLQVAGRPGLDARLRRCPPRERDR